jgi:hypothetical protein
VKLLLALLLSLSAQAKTVRIAVIDTGLPLYKTDLKICDGGLLNYSADPNVHVDPSHHGTNITGIISDYLGDSDYCVVFIKIYNGSNPYMNILGYMGALTYVYYHSEIDIVNFSSSGTRLQPLEEFLVKSIVSNGTVFVAAAGNDKKDLDKSCNVYPACYAGVVSVGNVDKKGLTQFHSNYGKIIKAWENGTDQCHNNVCMTGTSMSAALHSAKLAKHLLDLQKK